MSTSKDLIAVVLSIHCAVQEASAARPAMDGVWTLRGGPVVLACARSSSSP